jgi:hypothetical protein
MTPKGSLSQSQTPVTCPSPEPNQSSPCLPIPILEDILQYYNPIYALVSQVVPFPQVSPPKPCIHLSYLPYMLHSTSISFLFIWSTEQHLARSAVDLFALHSAVHPNVISIVKPTTCTSVSNLFYFGMKLYMFRTAFPSIIRSSRLYLQQHASNQSAVSVWHMPVAVCTVLQSWGRKERPSKHVECHCIVNFILCFIKLVLL